MIKTMEKNVRINLGNELRGLTAAANRAGNVALAVDLERAVALTYSEPLTVVYASIAAIPAPKEKTPLRNALLALKRGVTKAKKAHAAVEVVCVREDFM